MSGKVRFMSRSTSRGRHFYTNRPYRTRTGVEPKFWLQTGDFFAAWWGARGSAPPRRAAAAYGVAYLSTKCLGEVKSSSGRAAMFVAAKTFFVRNLEISPHSHSNYPNYDLIPTDSKTQDRALPPERTPPSARRARRPPVYMCFYWK